jgi:hypothetical protein
MRVRILPLLGCAVALASFQAMAQDRVAEYRALNKDIDGLVVYNQLLERQIQDQLTEVEAMRMALEQVPELERQIPPLLTRIIAGLEEFVALDLPFQLEERQERIAQLKTIIERTDVTLADKFRRVLEALQIENEYGRDMVAYNGELQIDGVDREVQFLRVGRIALLYQTPDAEFTGAWDQGTHQWVALGNEHRNSVRNGLRMARAQVAPDLLLVPLPAPTEG